MSAHVPAKLFGKPATPAAAAPVSPEARPATAPSQGGSAPASPRPAAEQAPPQRVAGLNGLKASMTPGTASVATPSRSAPPPRPAPRPVAAEARSTAYTQPRQTASTPPRNPTPAPVAQPVAQPVVRPATAVAQAKMEPGAPPAPKKLGGLYGYLSGMAQQLVKPQAAVVPPAIAQAEAELPPAVPANAAPEAGRPVPARLSPRTIAATPPALQDDGQEAAQPAVHVHPGSGGSRMGDLFIRLGRLSEQQVAAIVRKQEDAGLRFGEAAVVLGYLSEEEIQKALAQQFDYHVVINPDTRFHPSLVTAVAPYGQEAEAIRTIRAQIAMGWKHAAHRWLALISPERAEGRSYLAANLAISFSQLGERTLLIDADLRKPQQHELFGCGNKFGLSTLLMGRNTGSVIHQIDALPKLSVLPAGPLPPNPVEVLREPRLAELMDTLSENYDIIILDTPPALTSSDAELVARQAGYGLVVGRRDHSTLKALKSTINGLDNAGVRVLGTIFNDFDAEHSKPSVASGPKNLLTQWLAKRLGRVMPFGTP